MAQKQAARGARMLRQTFGSTRLIVELGVFSPLTLSLTLFIAAIVQAYHTLGDAFRHLGEPETIKRLLILGLALQTMCVGRLQNVLEWLHMDSFDDEQKLLGMVVTVLSVNCFAVALEWTGDNSILFYSAASAAVILAVGVYSSVLSRIHETPAHAESGKPNADAHP